MVKPAAAIKDGLFYYFITSIAWICQHCNFSFLDDDNFLLFVTIASIQIKAQAAVYSSCLY